MARKRSNIYKRKDGRYEGRIARNDDSQQKGYIYVYARTLRELRRKMEAVRRQESGSGEIAVTLQQAAQEWLKENRENWKPTTYALYYRLVFSYIIPNLGTCRVDGITQPVFNAFEKSLKAPGEQEQLSEPYCRLVCKMVCRILESAQKRIGIRLCVPAFLPDKSAYKEIEMPKEAELKRLEEYLLGHLEEDTCLGILTAACTGIRIGELCALQWADIDLESGFLKIRKNLQRVPVCDWETGEKPEEPKTRIRTQLPKTPRSQRTIPLPDGLLALLRMYAKPQESYLISGKKAPWAEVRTVQYRFSSILKKCDIRPFRFHLLRHAFASRCLDNGCDLKCLSEIMGHSSVSTTMNLYVHPTMKKKKQVMDLACRIP